MKQSCAAIMNSTKGPPKDLKAGLAYLKKARDCGDYTGAWLIDILASSPRDLDQAFAKYAKHCDKNEYVQIGECYLEGVAVEQNTERALSRCWLRFSDAFRESF